MLDIIIAYRRAKHSEAIRDKARALEVYARQARNVDAETRACEIRLRAERAVVGRTGEEQGRSAGGKPVARCYRFRHNTVHLSTRTAAA